MANNITVKDAATVDTVVKTTDNAGVHTPHQNIDSLPSLPAGSNNIGDVDVLSVVPGTAATNLGKAVGSPAGATDTGVAIVAIRDNALSALSDPEGDYVPLRVDANGALHVVAQAGSAEQIEGAPFTEGASAVVVIGVVRDDSLSALAASEGDATVLRVGSTGALHTQLSAALPAGTNNIGDVDVLSLPALPAGSNNIGDVGVLSLPALPAGSNNIGDVDVLSIVPGTAATNLGKAVGAVAGATDTGVAALAIRDNALSTLSDPEGGYVPFRLDSEGALWVTAKPGAAQRVDDTAFAAGSDSVVTVGYVADETSTDPVDEGDAGAARMTLDRKQIVTVQPHSAGGIIADQTTGLFRSLDLDETEEDIKTTPGCVYKIRITNLSASLRYVKFYNATAANVTVGTTTPVETIPVPAGAVITENFGGLGLEFTTAISIAATTGLADNDTGAPAANDVVVSVYFK